jgi:hypothetical protein
MMDNEGFVDIQIILTDDFHIQQTICLTDLICEKYKIYLQIKKTKFFHLVLWNYYKINVVYVIYKLNIRKYFVYSQND